MAKPSGQNTMNPSTIKRWSQGSTQGGSGSVGHGLFVPLVWVRSRVPPHAFDMGTKMWRFKFDADRNRINC